LFAEASTDFENEVRTNVERENQEIPAVPATNGTRKLPQRMWVRAMLGIVLILILGVGLLLLVWIGARVTRRYIRSLDKDHPIASSTTIDHDDWARKPLVPRELQTDADDDEVE
jgi:hypothetical protein